MDQPIKIFRFGIEDAQKVTSSMNEPHTHDFEEILIGMDGSIEHFIDFETTIIPAPYVCFVSKRKMHRVKPILKDCKCDVWVIRFQSEFAAEIIFQLYSAFHNNANIFWPVERLTGRLPVLTEMMYNELTQPSPDFSIIRHLLNAVISIVLSEKQQQQSADVSTNQNETFTNFLSILEENFRRPLSVGFYAEKLFMSTRNLNLICQNILQQSVSEIIETRKLIEAKNLLTSTDKTVAEIAYELGYNENSYFSNVFKKKSGQTPGEFREEMKTMLTS
ncbi:helix-turn-helix domain-containing protein [Winogradskyella sp. MIT101101]|uniref:AraC family transcriptional regulator n=1 Tax=Winogradskyella sp. MIT101101 TaxID=3098297 RepID=UPI00399ADE87